MGTEWRALFFRKHRNLRDHYAGICHFAGRYAMLVCIIFTLFSVTVCAAAKDPAIESNNLDIRKTHLDATALAKEYEMDAAITYTGTLFSTDTAMMISLRSQFHQDRVRIPQVTDDGGLALIIADMKNLTQQFTSETRSQVSRGQGQGDDVKKQMGKATEGNPYIDAAKNTYWSTRTKKTLDNFDRMAGDAQVLLDTLKNEGYDTASAQRALDVVGSQRPALKAALESKNEIAIQDTTGNIYRLSEEYVQKIAGIASQVPKGEKMQFILNDAYRAVSRADSINREITAHLLDIGPADLTLTRLKKDLDATRRLLNAGRTGMAETALLDVKKDFTDLAASYRDIAHTAALPADLTSSLETMAIILDETSLSMGVGT
jgi:hypothetical protein